MRVTPTPISLVACFECYLGRHENLFFKSPLAKLDDDTYLFSITGVPNPRSKQCFFEFLMAQLIEAGISTTFDYWHYTLDARRLAPVLVLRVCHVCLREIPSLLL